MINSINLFMIFFDSIRTYAYIIINPKFAARWAGWVRPPPAIDARGLTSAEAPGVVSAQRCPGRSGGCRQPGRSTPA
jgi:hypothetical protein